MIKRLVVSFAITVAVMLPIGWFVNGRELPLWLVTATVVGALVGPALAEALGLGRE